MKLVIEKQIYGGSGLARHEGKAIFVPFTLPGETLEAEITINKGSYAEAHLTRIEEPSPSRTTPPCPYFGTCGGCHYQHANYTQQLTIKRQILEETLERARIPAIPAIDTLCADPLRYRNRARFHIDRLTSKLSYKKRASHVNLPVDECPIAASLIEQTLQRLNAQADGWQLAHHYQELELFTNADQSAALLTLWTAANPQAAAQQLSSLWPRIQQELPHILGAAVFSIQQGQQSSRLLASAGARSLTYTAAGRGYRVSTGSFFQVNRHLIDPLVQLVTTEASGKLAWDLYAGAGLFACALESAFEQIVAVESAPTSTHDLRHNLNGGRHRTVASGTLEFLRRAHATRQPIPDLVVADPPRAGLGSEVTKLLAQLRPAHITYVSCDPATLSRDLKSLLNSGYALHQLHLIDMFPQTFHLETVAKLSLK
jgi:23S rRNA (uracil1939-C5)-methyltransferase